MSEKPEGSSTILLTHLQQLRLWQQQQQESLRNIQKEQFEQIRLEREKVKELLDKHSEGQKGERKVKNAPTFNNASSNYQKTVSMAQIKDNEMEKNDIEVVENNAALEETEKPKGPFRFLKKGEGIARFGGKSTRARTKSAPNFNSNKPVPKINTQPETRILVRKLKLIPNTRRHSDVPVLSEQNQSIPPRKEEDFERNCGESEDNTLDSSQEVFQEKEDLAEFEILEKVARNCSFNSDSSLMTKLVNRGKNIGRSSPIPLLESDEERYTNIAHSPLLEPQVQNLQGRAVPLVNDADLRWKSSDIDDDNKSCSSASSESLKLNRNANEEIVEMVGLKKYCEEMMQRLAAGVPESADESEELEKVTKWKDFSSMEWSESTSPFELEIERDTESKPTISVGSLDIHENENITKNTLKELEDEIAEFKKQNNALLKLRKQHEDLMKQLTKEHSAFKKQQSEAKEKFETYMKEEKLKLRKQKQAFQNYQKSKKDFPDKKEREEIAALKIEVQKLQEELKRQRSQLTGECGRLRAHASSMESERSRMKSEVQRLQTEKSEILAALKELKSKPPVVKRLTVSKLIPKKAVTKPKSPVRKSININKKPTNSKLVRKESASGETCFKTISIPESFDEMKPKQKVRFANDIRESELSIKEAGSICDQSVYQEINHFDKVERIYFNGEREYLYKSGTRRLITEDCSTETVYFYNGDVLLILPDKSEVYHFIDSGIKQTKYPDGMTLVEFPDGQEERLHKDGCKEVSFKDGSIHLFYPDGTQEIKSSEGSVLKIYTDGSEILELTNGEREIHTTDFKRREFPDGTIKIAHSDGKIETRYPNGRIRIKDQDNNIIVDTKYIS